jgi:annexin A7/11
MKGIGTNEKALIQVLSPLDPLEMAAVRTAYSKNIGRDLRNDIDSETSGSLGKGLLAIVDGPLMHDVTCANEAVRGFGTKEWLLNEVLLGRSNADMNAIKTAYKKAHYTALEEDVEKDLSFKTAGLFKNVLLASRHEESAALNPQTVESEVRALHGATSGRMVNDVSEVFGTFARSSDSELRAINQTFNDRYHTPLEQWIVKEFAGHMEDAFLHILRTALDPAMRDALLLQGAMKGAGTDDSKLITRVVRLHWNRMHREQVKRAYKHQFKQDLIANIRSETNGDYERLMVALLE